MRDDPHTDDAPVPLASSSQASGAAFVPASPERGPFEPPSPLREAAGTGLPRQPGPQPDYTRPAEAPRRPRELRPGEILLKPRARLSLARLFKLEMELGQLPGVRDVIVKVLPDGQVSVMVTPDAEVRVREFLILNSELDQGSPGRE